jgi:hypothetical protein
VGNHGIAIDAARLLSRAALRKLLHLAFQLGAGALRTPGSLAIQHKAFKTGMALLAYVFENWHGSFHLDEIITAVD